MADISNVDNTTIKDLYERLESLSCTDTISLPPMNDFWRLITGFHFSPDHDENIVLSLLILSSAGLYCINHST